MRGVRSREYRIAKKLRVGERKGKKVGFSFARLSLSSHYYPFRSFVQPRLLFNQSPKNLFICFPLHNDEKRNLVSFRFTCSVTKRLETHSVDSLRAAIKGWDFSGGQLIEGKKEVSRNDSNSCGLFCCSVFKSKAISPITCVHDHFTISIKKWWNRWIERAW